MSKEEWKAAMAEVEAIEREREALLAPTKERYEAARDKLESIVDALDCGDFLGLCINCREPMFDGDRIHRGDDESLCYECAPTYRQMLDEHKHFISYETGEAMTREQAQAAVDRHLSQGGSLDDKMVSS